MSCLMVSLGPALAGSSTEASGDFEKVLRTLSFEGVVEGTACLQPGEHLLGTWCASTVCM